MLHMGGRGSMQHTKGQESEEMQHHEVAPPHYKIDFPQFLCAIKRGFFTQLVISRIYFGM